MISRPEISAFNGNYGSDVTVAESHFRPVIHVQRAHIGHAFGLPRDYNYTSQQRGCALLQNTW